MSGKEKHINIKKSGGLSQDWVGGKIMFMCFWGIIRYGEKIRKQNSQKIPGQSHEVFVYVFVVQRWFLFCSQRWGFLKVGFFEGGKTSVIGVVHAPAAISASASNPSENF